jgi:hypothetical protein
VPRRSGQPGPRRSGQPGPRGDLPQLEFPLIATRCSAMHLFALAFHSTPPRVALWSASYPRARPAPLAAGQPERGSFVRFGGAGPVYPDQRLRPCLLLPRVSLSGNRATRRKPRHAAETAPRGRNRATRQKPRHAAETAPRGGNRATRRKPRHAAETAPRGGNRATRRKPRFRCPTSGRALTR